MYYFTADWHLLHRFFTDPTHPRFRGEHRPQHYQSLILDRYAYTVTDGDTAYILGDVLFQPHTSRNWFAHIAQTLPGRKILVRGNHDDAKRFPDKYWIEECGFASVLPLCATFGAALLSHFPMVQDTPGDLRYKREVQQIHIERTQVLSHPVG